VARHRRYAPARTAYPRGRAEPDRSGAHGRRGPLGVGSGPARAVTSTRPDRTGNVGQGTPRRA
jgi:hypothetical protein